MPPEEVEPELQVPVNMHISTILNVATFLHLFSPPPGGYVLTPYCVLVWKQDYVKNHRTDYHKTCRRDVLMDQGGHVGA